HGHRRVRETRSDEPAVRPGLAREPDPKPADLGEPIVIDAERPSDVDDHAVDLILADPGVLERGLERLNREPHRTLGSLDDEPARSDADESGPIAKAGHRDGGASETASMDASLTFCTLPVAVSGSSSRFMKRKCCGTLNAASRARQYARSS